MNFGTDIYALAVAILHKKNAKHLKYYDENERKIREYERLKQDKLAQ